MQEKRLFSLVSCFFLLLFLFSCPFFPFSFSLLNDTLLLGHPIKNAFTLKPLNIREETRIVKGKMKCKRFFLGQVLNRSARFWGGSDLIIYTWKHRGVWGREAPMNWAMSRNSMGNAIKLKRETAVSQRLIIFALMKYKQLTSDAPCGFWTRKNVPDARGEGSDIQCQYWQEGKC